MAEQAHGGDDFERRYMAGEERVLHRDKRITRGMAALVALPGLVSLGGAVAVAVANAGAAEPVSAAGMVAMMTAMVVFGLAFLALAVAMAVIRVLVTDRALHIKYGLSGPTIALSSIRKVRVVDYDWTMYGGWGMRRGRDGSVAFVAQNGPVLEVTYDKDGTEHRVLVGAGSPRELAERLEQARAGAAAASGVRVAAATETTDSAGAAMAEAEAEAEAVLADEAAQRSARR